MGAIALWAPDITPPDEWLIPALLYQERIATFAPLPYLRDADGEEARRLENLVGDLYEPVHFATGRGTDPGTDHMFCDIVRTSLPLWLSYAEGILDREPDLWLRSWVSRVNGWPDRFGRLHDLYHEATEELRQARHALAETEAHHQRLQAEMTQRNTELTSQMDELKEQLRAERRTRQERLAPLKAERESLLRDRRNANPNADAKLRAVNAELKAVSESLRSTSRASQRYGRLRSEQSLLAALLQTSATSVAAAKRTLTQAANRLDRQRGYLDRPWSGERRLVSWLDSRRIDTRPPGLDTIAFGKVYGPVFEFLANDCGMWVAEDPDRRYAGTLVGPRQVVREIIEILAECHAATRPGWVLMSKLRAQAPLCASGDDEIVSLILPYVLPAPCPRPTDNSSERDSYLAAVTRFRRNHEDELQILRDAMARELPAQLAARSLAEATQAIRESMAGPLAEISRALSLDRQLGLKPVGVKVIQHLGHGAIGLALSTAAAAIATPLVGDTIGLQSTAAAVIGGSIIGFTTMTTSSVADLYRRRTLTRRIERSPYRYLYDVGINFSLR